MDDSPLDRPLEKPRADTGEGRARLAHACLMLARQLERFHAARATHAAFGLDQA